MKQYISCILFFLSVITVAQTIEKVCIECVEKGAMTKDLAILVGPASKYLTTKQFLDVIDGNLKKKLNYIIFQNMQNI
mgnify:CR=1 FL=1